MNLTLLRMTTDVAVETKLLRIQYSPRAEGTLSENQPTINGRNFKTCVPREVASQGGGEGGGRGREASIVTRQSECLFCMAYHATPIASSVLTPPTALKTLGGGGGASIGARIAIIRTKHDIVLYGTEQARHTLKSPQCFAVSKVDDSMARKTVAATKIADTSGNWQHNTCVYAACC